MINVPPHLRALLMEVVRKRHPDLAAIVETDVNAVSVDDRLELRESLADELCDTGLRDDDEPNDRGHQIESLIDLLGRLPPGTFT